VWLELDCFCRLLDYLLASMANSGQSRRSLSSNRDDNCKMLRLESRRHRAISFNSSFLVVAMAITAVLLSSCGASGPRPLSIQMFHPEKKITLDCKARDLGLADPNLLADSVEACARQLEKSGFVRQSSAPSAATTP